jgi:hypothetical protein
MLDQMVAVGIPCSPNLLQRLSKSRRVLCALFLCWFTTFGDINGLAHHCRVVAHRLLRFG